MQATGDGMATSHRRNKLPLFGVAQELLVDITLGANGTDLSCGVNDEVKKHLLREREREGRTKYVDCLSWDDVWFFKDGRALLRYAMSSRAVNLSEYSVPAATRDCRLNSVEVAGRPHLLQGPPGFHFPPAVKVVPDDFHDCDLGSAQIMETLDVGNRKTQPSVALFEAA